MVIGESQLDFILVDGEGVAERGRVRLLQQSSLARKNLLE